MKEWERAAQEVANDISNYVESFKSKKSPQMGNSDANSFLNKMRELVNAEFAKLSAGE